MARTKTPKEPKVCKPGYPRAGAGRQAGKQYPHLQTYPGILAEIRLAWSRMRAQAKFRNEEWAIDWQEFQNLWEGKWHLRGSEKGCLSLSRTDWELGWTLDNVKLDTRDNHWRRQRQAQIGKKHKKCD